MCRLCVTKILYCDWSVIGRLMRRMSLTGSHHVTTVGPIRFSYRSNNCCFGKITERRSSLVHSHHVIFVIYVSNKRRKSHGVCRALGIQRDVGESGGSTFGPPQSSATSPLHLPSAQLMFQCSPCIILQIRWKRMYMT